MTLSEKSAYLKGLMDGLKLDTEKDESKMIAAIVDMLSDVAETVADLEGKDAIGRNHISEAIYFRSLDRKYFNK